MSKTSKREESHRVLVAELSSIFRALDRDPGEKRGAFGMEQRAAEAAREVERQLLEKQIAELDRGYEGNTRKCPKCGKASQRYKGDSERKVEFECGEILLKRSYYVCCECGESSFPLEDKLGLVPGKEQGRLRSKLSLLGVLVPYHQAPQVCKTMLGSERHATRLRRVLLREAERYENSPDVDKELAVASGDTLYLQIDGHMCPTREERKDPADQGFREAKAVLAYRDSDVVEVSKKRREILQRILKAEITTSQDFLPIVKKVYDQAHGEEAKLVVVLGDGAKWIWNIVDEIAPGATQVLDFAHAKQRLYDFAKIRFQHTQEKIRPWVKQQEDLLFNDKVQEVITRMKQFADLDQGIQEVVTYFENNASRMYYGTYQKLGLTIGSGAIESAGKQISRSRVKGPGMRWNIKDLNPVLTMRCAFLDTSWNNYWDTQEKMAA